MVRTKADASTRVAAGGKAPKKSAARAPSVASPMAGEKGGKDHLPGNRACPRETPNWQKKITFFYDKNAGSSKSTDDGEGSSSDNLKNDTNQQESNDAAADESLTQAEKEDNAEMEEEKEMDESESMETDE